MGLKLGGEVPSQDFTEDHVRGRVVAVDLANLAYPFYTTALYPQHGHLQPGHRAAAIRHMTRSALDRFLTLGELGARSVAILDGEPHPLKRELLRERAAARDRAGIPALVRDDYLPLVRLLVALGVPVVRAPFDAEAQGAWMTRHGHAHVVATTDWDALAMGARQLLRNLSGQPFPRDENATRWTTVDAAASLEALDVDLDGLAVAAVMMGCDYYAGFDRIGVKRALKAVREHRGRASLNPEHGLLEACAFALHVDADLGAARAALDVLTDPPHTDVDLEWHAPDLPELERLLLPLAVELTPAYRARLARTALTHAPRSVTP